MAAGEKPPIIGTAVMGWRDGLGAINAMPVVAGIAFIILLIIGALSTLLLPAPAPGSGEAVSIVASIVSSIIRAFVVAPLAIAVHRYVLLGEVTPGYALDPSSPRYMRFVGFAILVNLLLLAPSLILVVPMMIAAVPAAMTAVGGIVAFVLFVFVMIVALRRTILFPAVAVDAPGASWTNARNDTMGNSWRVAFILFCTIIPTIVVSVPFYFLLMWPLGGVTTFAQVAFSVISTVIQLLSICTLAAAASHIFRTLAHHLATPPASAPAG